MMFVNPETTQALPLWITSGSFLIVFLLLILWSLFWKGLALWHAGRKAHSGWFIACLLLNTAGILEIIYLFGIRKLKGSQLFKK